MHGSGGTSPPPSRTAVLLGAAWLALAAGPAAAEPVLLRPQYRVQASVEPSRPQIEGTVEVAFTNHSNATLDEAVFFLFPNRFAEPDADHVNDFTRPFLYPEQEFDSGSMRLLEVSDGVVLAQPIAMTEPGLPAGTVMRVPIATLAPGATRRLRLRFQTVIPHRFGSFGEFNDRLTAIGGWYPYLAELDASGRWAVDAPPPLADFDVALTVAPGLELVLNGRYLPPGAPPSHHVVPRVHYLSLVAAPRFLRDETAVDGTRIVYLHPPARLSSRISFGPRFTEIILATLRQVLAERPAALPAPAGDLVVVEAPMRLNLTAPGEGDVIVSDRLLKLHEQLRPFHQLQLAAAVYAELLRPMLAAREPAADYPWVSEGLSHLLAERYMDAVEPSRRSVYDWIELFNVFAVVDRFESTPKIPFVNAFFDRAKEADPQHGEITTFNQSGPPGRVVLGKLRDMVGPPAFDALLDQCLQAATPLRACTSAAVPDADVQALYVEWLAPYPAIDYRVEDTRFNQPEDGQYHSSVAVRRISSRPFTEPVTVRLKTLGGADVDLQWKSGGDVAIITADTPQRVYQAIIDPERRLVDDDRSNNAWPPRPQIVLDSADVEVSSTEFGISALVVGRARYDYRKDVAAVGFYTNRGIGFTLGGRLHWGEPIDATKFHHNLYGFYVFEALDSSFKNDAQPTVRTKGNLGGIGARYDYNNVFWNDNPSDQRRFRLYADWFDKNLGSDFGYLDWGYVGSATTPIVTPRVIAAGQVFNGFSEAFDSLVPNQGLYSLGGSHSIRGIGAEKQLARNIMVLRTELRYALYPEVDLNLHDFLVLRRLQVHLLLDTGNVSNSAGRIYDIGRWAAGAGIGFGAIYDFMGFFSATAYLEIATRIDDPSQAGDVQVLFGSNQAF